MSYGYILLGQHEYRIKYYSYTTLIYLYVYPHIIPTYLLILTIYSLLFLDGGIPIGTVALFGIVFETTYILIQISLHLFLTYRYQNNLYCFNDNYRHVLSNCYNNNYLYKSYYLYSDLIAFHITIL